MERENNVEKSRRMKEILAGVYKPNRTAVMVVFLSSNKINLKKKVFYVKHTTFLVVCTKATNTRNCEKDQSEATQVNFQNEFNYAMDGRYH